MCLSDIPCLKCPRSWSAAGSPNLCTNLKLRLHQLDNICSSHSYFRFHRYRIGDTRWQELAEKYPTMARFGTHFGGACGILLRAEANHTHKPYIDELQILFSLYMPRHVIAPAVKGATSEQLRDRVVCGFPIYPVQGVRAAVLQLAFIFYAGV